MSNQIKPWKLEFSGVETELAQIAQTVETLEEKKNRLQHRLNMIKWFNQTMDTLNSESCSTMYEADQIWQKVNTNYIRTKKYNNMYAIIHTAWFENYTAFRGIRYNCDFANYKTDICLWIHSDSVPDENISEADFQKMYTDFTQDASVCCEHLTDIARKYTRSINDDVYDKPVVMKLYINANSNFLQP